MNEEEAIERLKKDKNKPLACGDITIVDIDDLELVLNLLEKKDKIIDEMANKLEYFDSISNDYIFAKVLRNKEQWKKYFERKLENGN